MLSRRLVRNFLRVERVIRRPILDSAALSESERIFSLDVQRVSKDASPASLQILGYIRNHPQYAFSPNVQFPTTSDMSCLARLEGPEEMDGVFLFLASARGVSDELYQQCVDALLSYVPESCSRLFVGFVPSGNRISIREQAFRKRGLRNTSRDDCACFIAIEDSAKATYRTAAKKPALPVVTSLTVPEAQIVSDNWPFSDIADRWYVGNMISSYPSSCIRSSNDCTGPPIAWILMVRKTQSRFLFRGPL